MHNTARLGSDRFIYLNTLLGALLVNSLFQLFMAFEELCSTLLEINWMNQSNLEINDMELELRSFAQLLWNGMESIFGMLLGEHLLLDQFS